MQNFCEYNRDNPILEEIIFELFDTFYCKEKFNYV